MRIRDIHGTREHKVDEGDWVSGFWRGQRGVEHYFGGIGFRAARGWAIGAWTFAYADPDSDWGVLDDGVVLTTPVPRYLVQDPETQARRAVEHAVGMGGDGLPGGRMA